MSHRIQNVKMLSSKLKVDQGGYDISWSDDLDLDAETIWENENLIYL